MLIVDTNVLIDVFENDPDWSDWSVGRLREHSVVSALVINPIIYAELSMAFSKIEKLDAEIAALRLQVQEIPRPALFLAAKAFAKYRKLGGTKTNVLADFFIGAHAAVIEAPVLTRDPARYRNYFPTIRLITPESERRP
ncbi:MAG: type II toxin-antitoxin system VapC family toxin [Pseudomonadota bacterium]